MKCGFCGAEMIWQSDFNSEDLGYDDNEIVTFYSCPIC